ncbi:hypothetical protein FB599_2289 [Herbaspirillum sp. SJZ130]|nr:hypothetical protein FB599_2289 [Herbaspirillum sp. SJZ130]TQK12378.1 hypothetical protein FB598_2331 [Herbaspirillum sp. SJZ106]
MIFRIGYCYKLYFCGFLLSCVMPANNNFFEYAHFLHKFVGVLKLNGKNKDEKIFSTAVFFTEFLLIHFNFPYRVVCSEYNSNCHRLI